MVKERMDLLELLRKGGMDGDVDFLREALRVLVEGIMDAEVSSRIGAEYGERSPERVTQRNGYRSRAWDTRVGTMELHIPKLREGSYFPSLLEPRRRSERALLAVIQQAYVEGVSTRRVDDLVKALGCEGISKSQVSRICQELDVVVDSFMGRPLDAGPYPYLWLDALTQKVREDGRIVNVSVVVATAVNGEGKREIIGMDVGTSEDGAFWLAFLRSLSARGLGGVELVVSDAHQILRVKFVHALDDGLKELACGGVVGLLGDGDDADAPPAKHGLEGDGVLPLSGEAGELPDQYLLEGGLGLAGLVQHPSELGPVGDAPALRFVHVLAGDQVAVSLGIVPERP